LQDERSEPTVLALTESPADIPAVAGLHAPSAPVGARVGVDVETTSFMRRGEAQNSPPRADVTTIAMTRQGLRLHTAFPAKFEAATRRRNPVELLREKHRRRLQDLVGLAQLAHLAAQPLELLTLALDSAVGVPPAASR